VPANLKKDISFAIRMANNDGDENPYAFTIVMKLVN